MAHFAQEYKALAYKLPDGWGAICAQNDSTGVFARSIAAQATNPSWRPSPKQLRAINLTHAESHFEVIE